MRLTPFWQPQQFTLNYRMSIFGQSRTKISGKSTQVPVYIAQVQKRAKKIKVYPLRAACIISD